MSVRVRFAPSPTGKLHVGSARTALFNWLFAKHNKGSFILRIEDTDQKRSKTEFLDDIYDSLTYLGIVADEGPIFQSQRLPIYQAYAKKLLEAGKAKTEENGGIVFQTTPQDVTFQDLLRGPITVNTDLFETIVLMKGDGLPTYNFACVVDDALMQVSHVIRGDDHIANTPKQVVLYQALGFDLPIFAHIPLIVGADRARLSKRFGATSVNEYRAVGYLPEAFFNYLALLGWSPGNNREQVPPAEIIQLFDLTKVKKAAAAFDQKKLDWLNSEYIKQTPAPKLAELLAGRLQQAKLIINGFDRGKLERIAALVQSRLRVLEDIEEEHAFFFLPEPIPYQEEAVANFLKQPLARERLADVRAMLAALPSFDAPAIEAVIRGYQTQHNLQPKQLIQPVRVAVSGRQVSPPLFETLAILGKDTTLQRLDHAIGLAQST